MRIGASIIFYNGYCYQSYKWSQMRPLGDLNTVMSFLDSYEVDEICITRPIRANENHDFFRSDIKVLSKTFTNSPLSFGGGLRSEREVKYLSQLPLERIHLSNAFININEPLIIRLIKKFGRQAIIASLPLKIDGDLIYVFDGVKNKFILYTTEIDNFVNDYADEVVLIDTENEGLDDKFNFNLIKKSNFLLKKIVITGGIGSDTIKTGDNLGIASCLIENKVLHKENYIKRELR